MRNSAFAFHFGAASMRADVRIRIRIHIRPSALEVFRISVACGASERLSVIQGPGVGCTGAAADTTAVCQGRQQLPDEDSPSAVLPGPVHRLEGRCCLTQRARGARTLTPPPPLRWADIFSNIGHASDWQFAFLKARMTVAEEKVHELPSSFDCFFRAKVGDHSSCHPSVHNWSDYASHADTDPHPVPHSSCSPLSQF